MEPVVDVNIPIKQNSKIYPILRKGALNPCVFWQILSKMLLKRKENKGVLVFGSKFAHKKEKKKKPGRKENNLAKTKKIRGVFWS